MADDTATYDDAFWAYVCTGDMYEEFRHLENDDGYPLPAGVTVDLLEQFFNRKPGEPWTGGR